MEYEDDRSKPLKNMRCLIVGGAGGIGLATASAYLADGADVTIADLSEDRLSLAVEALAKPQSVGGGELNAIICDAMNEAEVSAAVESVAGDKQKLDVAITIVGGGGGGPLIFLEKDILEKSLLLNILPAFFLLKHAGAIMRSRRQGSIVVISSIAAVLSSPLMGAYSAAKAGLDAIVRVAADELGSSGVRVNAVRPGFTRTPATEQLFSQPEYVDSYLAEQALKRAGTSEDIAAAVRFLGCDESSWITGQCLNVDGGLSLHRIPKRHNHIGSTQFPTEWRDILG